MNKLSTLNSQLSTPKGFTLIELLVVIAIIGLLTAFLVANFVGVKQRARDAQRKSDLRNIQSALEIYRSDEGIYPEEIPECGNTWEKGTATYMQTVPCDPLNESPYVYTYVYTSADGTYTLKGCLENTNDSQKDGTNTCTSGVSFTLKNP